MTLRLKIRPSLICPPAVLVRIADNVNVDDRAAEISNKTFGFKKLQIQKAGPLRMVSVLIAVKRKGNSGVETESGQKIVIFLSYLSRHKQGSCSPRRCPVTEGVAMALLDLNTNMRSNAFKRRTGRVEPEPGVQVRRSGESTPNLNRTEPSQH
ncbi:hypothetical protein GGX14DRAFT_396743 [Mycena pura]|uniref:Uncharacterized protein n=1 Tax=Mycena pura TaxID=153505 RepID=A0AAD6VDN7_9AGAR|nr:hypothetical protein GGX14DRAFT_396743 [Mycena pura]